MTKGDQTMKNSARQVALSALSAFEKGAWSEGYLKHAIRAAGMDSRDAALATRLCFGVLQNRMLLDFYLAHFCSMKLEKLEEKVLQSMRLGAYQLCFMDRIPHSAAVNESVSLAKQFARNPRAGGLVNGVLRSMERALPDGLPQPDSVAVQYSHPEWLVKEFSLSLNGGNVAALLAADNAEPPMTVQVNTCKNTTAELTEELQAGGVTVTAHPWLDDCLLLSDTGDLERLPAFQRGAFYVQDAAAKLAVLAADPRPGDKLLDACAAPGGKSFAAAIAMGNMGEIQSCDIHPHKEKLIQAGAERLGLTAIHAQVQDGKVCRGEWVDDFDVVMADVPCSGLGIIRKKPDIRYKDPAPLAGLPAVQLEILDNVCRYVKQGGVLLYATCTLLHRENEEIVARFLTNHPDFRTESFILPGPIGKVPGGQMTFWPHLHGTDGFFTAKLRRTHD